MNDHAVNAALVVVSVLLVLSGLEVTLAAGVVEAHPNENWNVEVGVHTCENLDGKSVDKFHPEYGWTRRPGALYYGKVTPAQEWERNEIDDEGFRDTYDTGKRGAIVLGDSFTYGFLASNDEAFPHLLDRWNSNVSFHSHAVGGYGPQQYYLIYEDKAEEIDHDLVVVGYYLGNDINTMYPHPPARPVFNLSDGELRQVHEPEPDLDFSDPPEHEASVEERLTVGMALLDGIGEIAAENDAEVLVVTLPTNEEVRTETTPGWVADQREAIDQLAAEESNVHSLHTKPALEEAREDRRVYAVYDHHPDDHGYYVLARSIQSWLVEHDDETGVEVTADPGPPDGGLLARTSGYLWYNTRSYGFLSRRTGLLVHRTRQRLGLDGPGEDLCE